MPTLLEKGIFRQQDSSDSGIPPNPAKDDKLGLDMSEPPIPVDSSTALGNTVLRLSGTFLTAAHVHALNTIDPNIFTLVKNAMPEGASIAAQDIPALTRTVLLEIIPTLERLWKSEKPDSPEEERLFNICQAIKKGSRNPLPSIAKDIYRRLDIPVSPEYAKRPSGNPDYERELERLTRLIPPGTVSGDGHIYTEEELERTAEINIRFLAKGARQTGEKPRESHPKKPEDAKIDVEALLKKPHYANAMQARNNGDSNDQIARDLKLNPHKLNRIISQLIQAKLVINRGKASEQPFMPKDLQALRLLYLTPQDESIPRDNLTPMFYEIDKLNPKQLTIVRNHTPQRIRSLNDKLKRSLHLPPDADALIVNAAQNPHEETARYQIRPDFKPQVKEILEKNDIPLAKEPEEPKIS